MKSRSARHAAHGKHLQLHSFAGQIGVAFVPIYLGFHAPVITLRNAGDPLSQAECPLPLPHVLTHRSLTNLTASQFRLYAIPNSSSRMSLFSWRFPVCFQD